MTDMDNLIAEARERVPYGRGNGDLLARLADALESVRAERDAALARIAEAAKLHRNAGPSQEYDPRFRIGYGMLGDCCATCGYHGEYGDEWPCPTAAALGLNEGENDEV